MIPVGVSAGKEGLSGTRAVVDTGSSVIAGPAAAVPGTEGDVGTQI